MSGIVQGGLSPEIMIKMQEALLAAENSGGKSVIAFVGNTGSGKSTSLNTLAGKTMGLEGGKIVVVPPDEPVAPIGHSGSETMLARVYVVAKRAFADTGGFLDTRGLVSEVVVPFSAKWTLQNASGVKLLLCVHHAMAKKPLLDRGAHLTELLRTTLYRLAGERFDQLLPNSFGITFTHVDRIPTDEYDGDGYPINRVAIIEDFVEVLREMRDIYDEGSVERRIYDFVLREDGKYVSFIRPLDKGASRSTVLAMVDKMQAVANPAECFSGIPHSPSTYLQIKATMEGIGANGKQLFDDYELKGKRIEECEESLQKLASRVESLRKTLALLGSSNPEDVKKAKAELVLQIDGQISDKRQSIERHDAAVKTAEGVKATANGKLAELARKANELSDYDKREINEPPHITPSQKIQSRTWHGHLHGWRGRDVYSPEIRHEIERSVDYRGPTLAEVKMEPSSDTKYWVEQSGGGGHDSFHAKYKSDPGGPARATVTFMVKHKDLPGTVTEKAGLEREVQSQDVAIARQRAAIAGDQAEITKLEHMKETAQKEGNRAEELGNEIDEIEREKTNVQSAIDKAKSEHEEVREKLLQERENLAFLVKYLRVARDDSLKASPFIAPYLEVPDGVKEAVFGSSATK